MSEDLRARALELGWDEARVDEFFADAVERHGGAVEFVHEAVLVLRTKGDALLSELRDTRLETIAAANRATAHLVVEQLVALWSVEGAAA